jgi:hypothetical protein
MAARSGIAALIAVDAYDSSKREARDFAAAICQFPMRDEARPGDAGASQLMIGRARDIL